MDEEYKGPTRLKPMISELFNLDCEEENLLYKLDTVINRRADIEHFIKSHLGYPTELELYEYNNLVLQITPDKVNIYTKDEFEKIYPES